MSGKDRQPSQQTIKQTYKTYYLTYLLLFPTLVFFDCLNFNIHSLPRYWILVFTFDIMVYTVCIITQ